MRLPGRRARILRHTDGTRRIVRHRVAVEARLELKLWRLMPPWKPLPMEVPVTSTFALRQNGDGDHIARLEAGELVGFNLEFRGHTRLPRPPWPDGQPGAWIHARHGACRKVTWTAA